MDAYQGKESFVRVDGAKLFCRTFGHNEEKPPVIIVHGGPGLGHAYLLPQMAEIGKFSSAIFYDQRGAGRSIADDHWQSNPFQTYVNDLNQLREAFGFDKVSLLAHSWGGILASLYTLAHPQHIDKIIYLNSVPVSSKNYLEFVTHRAGLVDNRETNAIRESSAFLQGDPKTTEKFYRLYFKNYFANPELVNQLTVTMSPEAAINCSKIYNFFFEYVEKNGFDLYDGLRALNKPSLIVTCDKDIIPLHYMEQLHKTIPSSTWVSINNCGHFPYIEQPKILFSTLRNFMAL